MNSDPFYHCPHNGENMIDSEKCHTEQLKIGYDTEAVPRLSE